MLKGLRVEGRYISHNKKGGSPYLWQHISAGARLLSPVAVVVDIATPPPPVEIGGNEEDRGLLGGCAAVERRL